MCICNYYIHSLFRLKPKEEFSDDIGTYAILIYLVDIIIVIYKIYMQIYNGNMVWILPLALSKQTKKQIYKFKKCQYCLAAVKLARVF